MVLSTKNKRKRPRDPEREVKNPPTSSSENAIHEEVMEEAADEDGTVSHEAAEEIGALNAEAVRSHENRRNVLARKRAGERRVPWGENNACALYDNVVELYAPASMYIHVQRLSGGSPATWYLQSQPRSGPELYSAVQRQCHGVADEAEYRVQFVDGSTRLPRGIGRLTMPSTLGTPAPSAPPLGYAPNPPTMPGGPWVPPPQAAQPPAAPAPSGLTLADLQNAVGLQQRLAEMQLQLAAALRPGGGAPTPAPVSPPNPVPPGAPPPPPGSVVYVPNIGWCQVGAQQPPPPAPPPPPPADPARHYGDALKTVESLISITDKARGVIPAQGAPAAAAAPADEGPIRTLALGGINLVTNADDGQLRPVETALANGEKIMDWMQKQRVAMEQHQERMKQLELQKQREVEAAQQRAVHAQAVAAAQAAGAPAPPEPPPPPKSNGGISTLRMPPPSFPGVG